MMRLNNCFLILLFVPFYMNAQTDPVESIYRRSSLYTLMINEPARKYAETISKTFMGSPIPEKFNDHNLTERAIENGIPPETKSREEKIKAQAVNINNYFETNQTAKNLISIWFNRSNDGAFNMDYIAQSGSYNASEMDVKLAKSSERGLSILADAGEELIHNTFVVINDFDYVSKEEVAEKAKAGLALLKDGMKEFADVNVNVEGVDATLTVTGKGYVVRTTSYLYQLEWNDSIAAVFYNDYWMDANTINATKKQAFDNSNIFKLKYIGYEVAWADLQSTVYTTKTEEELISIATVRAIDNVIAKLQRKYEVFRTKTPLFNNNPLAAKIGLKEGLEKGDKYEVLEQVMDKKGRTSYKRKGVIKVEKDRIWDNRFMAAEEKKLTGEQVPTEDYTIFKGDSKYYIGWLIRQIN